MYRLEFWDRWDDAKKVGPGDSLTDVLESWGCWMYPWHYPWKIYNDNNAVIGRSAPYFDEEAK